MSISEILTTILLGMFISANNPPPTPSANYITSTNSHCKVGNPYPQPNESVTWSGKCVNGFAHGKGTVKWYENGKLMAVDVGTFRHGKQYGKGRTTWPSGAVYQGYWKADKKEGFGTLTLPKDDEEIDSWKNANQGRWQGDVYIVQGIFKDDDLKIECSSPKDCEQKQAQQK